MRKHIILIRHGKTVGNEQKRYIGRFTDEGLSNNGVNEIAVSKEAIRQLVTDDAVIMCGPMKRDMETARLLFEEKEICTVDDLNEIDFGLFEGKDHMELSDDPRYIDWLDSGGNKPFPGGESREDYIRVSLRGFYRAIEIMGDASEAVIVCHGGNIMSVMSSLTDGDYFDFQVKNLDGYILEIDTDGERIFDLTYDRLGDRIHT